MERKTKNRSNSVNPRKAAKQLRHLLSGRHIGVVMVKNAWHPKTAANIICMAPSVAAFSTDAGDHYIGNFLGIFGFYGAWFFKKNCRFLTKAEVRMLKKQNVVTQVLT
jgi:hypothetical protein